MRSGLHLWDTATVYGMGESERILETLMRRVPSQEVRVSTMFTPQLAEMYGNNVERMAEASMKRMDIDYIDVCWIRNPMDVTGFISTN